CTGPISPGLGDLFAVCVADTPAYGCDTLTPCLTDQPTVSFEPPQLMFVLDKSGSMFYTENFYDHDANPGTPTVSRWNALHIAVTNILDQYDALVDFGAK